MDEYDTNCDGCKISQGRKEVIGKAIIELEGGWLLNHYGGDEGYLGWLALQPRYHRMEMVDLNSYESTALGPNIQRVDVALRQYWSIQFTTDPIERVYGVYFLEGVFDKPIPSPYHLHIHLIPRTRKFDSLLRVNNDNGSMILSWNIYHLATHDDFPAEYRVKKQDQQNAVNLMIYLRGCLWKQ